MIPGLILFALVFLGYVVYAPAFHAPFLLDDEHLILENSLVKNFEHIGLLWKWYPSRFLTSVSYALNYHFNGLDGFYYHVINFSIHLLVVIVFYKFVELICKQQTITRAYTPAQISRFIQAATLIFLLHPIQTSTVNYVAQRSTLLATLFYLLAFIFYIKFHARKKSVFYCVALVAMAGGAISKPIIATLPLTLLLYEVCFGGAITKTLPRILLRLLPFIGLAVLVYLLLHLGQYKDFTWRLGGPYRQLDPQGRYPLRNML